MKEFFENLEKEYHDKGMKSEENYIRAARAALGLIEKKYNTDPEDSLWIKEPHQLV